MKGILVINEFLHSSKFTEIYEWLLVAAKKQGNTLKVYTNAELVCFLTKPLLVKKLTENIDFVLFWDKDIMLAKTLERMGLRVLNSSDAILTCDNKAETFYRLCNTGIRMPKTIMGPMTYENIGYTNMEFLKIIEEELPYPFVIKECFGSFGAQVYLVSKRRQAEEILNACKGKPVIFQEFIECSSGRDIRINMVGNTPVASMMRIHDTDFRANITNGGRMKCYTPNEAQIQMAQKVMEVLKLDFGGVDILFGEGDEPILCEVNSNAHFKNIYDCTGINVADAIMDYINR